MLAQLVTSTGISAAGIGAKVIDADDVMPQVLHRQLLQCAALKRIEPVGEQATHRCRMIERHLDLADLDRGRYVATGVRGFAHVDRAVGDGMTVEIGKAGGTAFGRCRHVPACR
jgi:hypothetical protein